jgi:hypothetical protein
VFRTEPDINGEEIEVKETSRRKKILFGDKEELVHVLVQGPAVFSLMLPAERAEDVDGLRRAVEAAKAEPPASPQ